MPDIVFDVAITIVILGYNFFIDGKWNLTTFFLIYTISWGSSRSLVAMKDV